MVDFLQVWELENKLYRRLSMNKTIRDPCTTVPKFLEIIEELDRSCVLKTGGWLFESYILRYGKGKDIAKLQNLIASENPDSCEDFATKMYKQYSLQFWYHVICAIHKVNKFATEPLQMFTFLLEYHGLSRMGLHLLGVCEVAIRPRTGDRPKKSKTIEYDDDLKRIILDGRAVIAFDNYNHCYGSAAIDLTRKVAWTQMNVTVGGISIMKRPIDQSFVHEEGTLLPSIPSKKSDLSKFIPLLLEKLSSRLDDLNEQVSEPFAYFEPVSMCRRRDFNGTYD